MRFLFYSHDGQGLGHVRRNVAIAEALTRHDPSASVLLVSSTDHIDSLVIPRRVDILKLPGIRKIDNSSYESRRLGMSAPETWALRSALLAAATQSFTPDVLLSDKHPYGAHGELRAALAILKAAGGRAVLGLRDILDDPATVRAEWAHGRVLAGIEAYERVLVYGSAAVLDVAAAYALPASAVKKLHYCGYVANTPLESDRGALRADDAGRPTVVGTAGGGADGYTMLDAFIRASRGAPWHPVVVSGTDATPEQQESLRRDVQAIGGTYHRFVRNLAIHFRDISALVCMGGYNTVVEALAAAVPTVVVPRVEPRQEQLIRARAFAGLRLLRSVEPERLTPPVLGDAVRDALADPRSRIRAAVDESLDLGGATRAAVHLLAVAEGLDELPVVPATRPVPIHVLSPRRSSDDRTAREAVDVAV